MLPLCLLRSLASFSALCSLVYVFTVQVDGLRTEWSAMVLSFLVAGDSDQDAFSM